VQPFCRVAVDSRVPALDRPFDYAIPDRLIGKVHPGSVVRVVLHGRGMRAFVTELLTDAAVPNPRPLRSLIAPEPVFAPSEIELARWVARRYVVPLGHVLHDAVPGRFSAPGSQGPATPPPRPTPAPAWLNGGLDDVVARRGSVCVFPPTLRDEPDLALHLAGVAASGGGRVLIICPRVEMVEAVAARIDDALVLHGDDRPSERATAWASARDGRAHVLVGGRSAILAPLPELGAVAVLSAHDRSLKAERAPRMHTVFVARQRAEMAGAAFIVSTPAPLVEVAADDALEWMGSARSNVRTEIVRPRSGPVTPRLVEVVRWAIERGTDALVFVARRGNTLRLRCQDCGWTPRCGRCSAGLAKDDGGRLTCRVCGTRAPVPATCASCGGALVERGWGHERVARTLEDAGIAVPVVRIVRDVVPEARPRPAVLVGTLAAVHEIDDAGSVSVADLDPLLARPDFRAAERALQTLHELAGSLRPGGRFLVQTREPDHHTVQAFARRSYRYFLDRELVFRKQTGYPPFGVVVRVEAAPDDIDDLRTLVRPAGAEVVGTVPRRGGVGALVRAASLEPLLDPLRQFAADHARARIDVDPVDVV
jgi:primosomal protein N' (replication factor Y)